MQGAQGLFDGAITSRLKATAPTVTPDELRKVCALQSCKP